MVPDLLLLLTAKPCITYNGPIFNGGTCPSPTASGTSCDINALCDVGHQYEGDNPWCVRGKWSTNPTTLGCTGVPSLGEWMVEDVVGCMEVML